MKIGVFDSGLGGLFTLRAIAETLPEYDYVYLGDMKRLPYGSRSHEEIYQFLVEALDFLFLKECVLVVVACNTASAEALKRVQSEYLPSRHPDKKVLGMIVPMTEACAQYRRVGLIATTATVHSGAYIREFKKRAPLSRLTSLATPSLVPFIESGDYEGVDASLKDYLAQFTDIDALLLGCTHYAIVKKSIRALMPTSIAIVAQDTVVPEKTRGYLDRHPEIEQQLSRGGTRAFFATFIGERFQQFAKEWFGDAVRIQKVSLGQDVK
ncbi:MAG: glutamate racemase [bacterium]